MEYYKIILIRSLFFILILSTEIFSQKGWFPINIIAKGNSLNCISFINDSMGYTISDEGIVLISKDYGNCWESIRLTESSLNDIFFINGRGFITGDNGKIFKSIDGINWTEKFSNTTRKLTSIYFLDLDTGYVFGDSSTILKTTDGGESWNNLNLSSKLYITDGAFPTPDFGMCTTLDGVLIRTLDYGSSWQYLGVGNPIYSIFFTDDNTAFLTGFDYDIGYLLKTTDRGNGFQPIYPNVIADIKSVYFTDPRNGYIVGTWGFISKTTNGGSSWNTLFNQSNKNLSSIFFTDSLNGYAVGEDSTILKTTNGGENWLLKGSGFTSQLMAVHFPISGLGYAVGTNGEVYKITDNEAILIYREPSIYNGFNFIYFINSLNGFAGATNGKFFTTTNGGQSWILTDFGPQDVISMRAIDFYQNQIGIVSSNKKLLKTTDAGQNWYVIDSYTSSFDVAFLNEQTLISVGNGGLIYESSTGGETWSKKNSPTTQSLNSVDFINENIGFAVGWNGTAIKTTDGGEDWSSFNLGANETLWKIKFIDQYTGYIIGGNGIIYHTTDSGNNWHIQNSNTSEGLNDIYFVNDTIGYIVGNSGTFLKTINGGLVGIEKFAEQPKEFFLYQNFPNPFNPITKINFLIPRVSFVTLKIYDMLGKEVATLVNKEKQIGNHEVEFDGRNLSSGIYFYRIQTGSFSETKKLVLLR